MITTFKIQQNNRKVYIVNSIDNIKILGDLAHNFIFAKSKTITAWVIAHNNNPLFSRNERNEIK